MIGINRLKDKFNRKKTEYTINHSFHVAATSEHRKTGGFFYVKTIVSMQKKMTEENNREVQKKIT